MHWFTHPPYLRWSLAALIVTAAFAVELWPQSTVAHPFASTDLPAGELLEPDMVEFRQVPAGLLPPVTPLGYTTRPISRGEPLTPHALDRGAPVPDDWWIAVVPLPEHVIPGTPARIVTATLEVDVIVASPGRTDGFDSRTFGTVAVPPRWAADVARAGADGTLVVLVRP